jgi:hypothetical protein
MPRFDMGRRLRRGVIVATLVFGGVQLLAQGSAGAHFILQMPASWWTQDGQGGPQKQGPCGNFNANEPLGAATGTVTPYVFAPGAARTIAITVNETIGHPGHYRVALAQTQGTLPAEPVVTPSATDPCASAAIQPTTTTPTVPAVLGDNLSPKLVARMGVQNFSVTVPDGLTCTNCTLQVIEFMSSHGLNVPGGCYYHHCANITIQNGGAGVGGRGGNGTGGVGGRNGVGGLAGIAGSSGSTGGRGGSSTASGGTGGSATASGGASSGTGGSPSGSGGATSGGTGGAVASGDASMDGGTVASTSGCGCVAVPGGSRRDFALVLCAGIALGVLGRHRRRRR